MTHWPPLPDPFPPMPEGSFTTLPPVTATLSEVKGWARNSFVEDWMSQEEAAGIVQMHVEYWRDWCEFGQ